MTTFLDSAHMICVAHASRIWLIERHAILKYPMPRCVYSVIPLEIAKALSTVMPY